MYVLLMQFDPNDPDLRNIIVTLHETLESAKNMACVEYSNDITWTEDPNAHTWLFEKDQCMFLIRHMVKHD